MRTTTGGNIAIYGGNVTATGGSNGQIVGGAGIGGGSAGSCESIIISGGVVNAYGGNNAAAIGCGNGFVEKTYCRNITISGGQVTAVAKSFDSDFDYGKGVGADYYGTCDSISLGWSNADDFLNLGSVNGTVQFTKNFVYANNLTSPVTVSNADWSKKLVPAYSIGTNAAHCTIDVPSTAGAGATVNLTVSPDNSYGVQSVTAGSTAVTKIDDTHYSFVMPSGNVTVSAVCVKKYTVTWKNADGTVLETDINESYGATPSYDGSTPTKASDDKYSYTFKEWSPAISSVTGDVTYTATYTKTPLAAHFSQSGNIYTIHDAEGWEVFCDLLAENEKGCFDGKTVKLDADITVSRPAGSDYHDFTGEFDGQNNKITLNIGSSDKPYAEYAALFCNTGDNGNYKASIHDLKVDGTIYTSAQYASGFVAKAYGALDITHCISRVTIHTSAQDAAGFVGYSYANLHIEDCVSDVTIISSVTNSSENDGTHSGFVGVQYNNDKYDISITGCAFTGKLLTTNGGTRCGGFIGWRNKDVSITNCIYAPASIADGENEVKAGTGDNISATFARNGAAITNCYYTRTLGTVQGKAAYTIAGAQDVTLGIYGNKTEENPDGCTVYSVSGITFYEGSSGLKYGDTYYAGKDESVKLTLGYEFPDITGYEWLGDYKVSAGTLEGSDDPYTLTMSEGNVTVSPVIKKAPVSVNYIDESGEEATVEAYSLDGTETTLRGGWYIVDNDVTFDHTITLKKFTGQVNLILADDRTMTVNIADENSDADGIDINDSLLNIFRQKDETGTLNVTTAGSGGAINLNDGLLYIYGGIINVTCSDKGKFAIGDTEGQAPYGRDIRFYGGKVTVNGVIKNINEETGQNFDIYFHFSGADDFVNATGYVGEVEVEYGNAISDGTDLYKGKLSNDQITAIAGKTLRFVYPVDINNVRGGTVSADKLFVYPDDQDKTVTKKNLNAYTQNFLKNILEIIC